MKKADGFFLLYAAWIIALAAALGSLYFSDIRGFAPCVLCWYQRSFMYPLVIVLGIGIVREDKSVYWYALPLSIAGLAIAVYHNFLYYRIIPESATPCVSGVSCTERVVEYFGFVGIPLLSLAAFTAITIALLVYKKNYGDVQK